MWAKDLVDSRVWQVTPFCLVLESVQHWVTVWIILGGWRFMLPSNHYNWPTWTTKARGYSIYMILVLLCSGCPTSIWDYTKTLLFPRPFHVHHGARMTYLISYLLYQREGSHVLFYYPRYRPSWRGKMKLDERKQMAPQINILQKLNYKKFLQYGNKSEEE